MPMIQFETLMNLRIQVNFVILHQRFLVRLVRIPAVNGKGF